MKKVAKFFLCALLILSFSVCSASAQTYEPQTKKDIVKLDDEDLYLEIVTTVYPMDSRSSQKYATKRYTYYTSDDIKVVAYLLKGWFEYDGTTSVATDVGAEAYIYQSGWEVEDHLEYCSTNSVYGAVKFSSLLYSKTLSGSITCDKNGNIT